MENQIEPISLILSDSPSSTLLKQHFHSQTRSLLQRYNQNRKYLKQVKDSAGRCLEFFPGTIKSRELAIYGLSQCGSYLSKCSEVLRNDELVVSIAVRQDGLSLQFASDLLRSRREIVMQAVQQNGMALKYVEKKSEMLKEREIVMKAILTTPMVLMEFNEKDLISDREMALTLIRQNPTIFKFLNSQLKSERDIQLEILSLDGKYLEFFNEDMLLCSDRKLAFLAARNSKLAYPFIEKSLRDEIALEKGDLTFVEKVSRIQIGEYALLTSNQIPCQIESIEKDYSSSKCGPSFKINISGRALFAQLTINNSNPIHMTYFASVSNLSALVCPFVYRIKCQLIGISENETLLMNIISSDSNAKLSQFHKNLLPDSIINCLTDSNTILEIIQVMGEQKIVSITQNNITTLLSYQ
ncbi:predicted protein [Naegleria gruberi]|uniref:Predicted protein n=1 Tax=Naegleria gruberi TaxID=5762 RepID=D2V7J5_NAEGR|nr:uncharacterized protein NAEGRDRAFT_64826 [Naegleria gruberi]EFC47262.1 predicted protein [Naegleria gruberi]|eukprot:XP_002680006.1 predicted protein [Naegleria gruberi strain NEG-M]